MKGGIDVFEVGMTQEPSKLRFVLNENVGFAFGYPTSHLSNALSLGPSVFFSHLFVSDLFFCISEDEAFRSIMSCRLPSTEAILGGLTAQTVLKHLLLFGTVVVKRRRSGRAGGGLCWNLNIWSFTFLLFLIFRFTLSPSPHSSSQS
jgi:hypothetical protein